MDLLHKADPWKGIDCGRELCFLCSTKKKTEKKKEQDCTKRSIVYENWCITCEKREIERLEEMEISEDEKKENLRKIKLYKYIGETARSSYERSLEHLRDYKEMKLDSHLLKHFLEHHKEEEMEEVEFGTRIVQEYRTAFDRQIGESVEINKNKEHHYILNSKNEYNRCALPRLTAKIGNLTIDKMEKQKKEEKEMERKLLAEIRKLKMKRSMKRREQPGQMVQPAQKRRKIEKNEYIRVLQVEQKQEKRNGTEGNEENQRTKRIKKTDSEETENKEIQEKPPKQIGEMWEEDTEKRWKEYIERRENEQREEEKEREERILRARMKTKSFEILK